MSLILACYYLKPVKFAFKFISRGETEYAMSLDGSEDLKKGFDVSKNINGFDLINHLMKLLIGKLKFLYLVCFK
ncbi:MAG: hypothetical protein HQ480_03410 [Candidatus Pelagibacter sp.]|jgi:hypothetical protein|nr:hypothetical protein [Candidatus Pelagibacter sp.]